MKFSNTAKSDFFTKLYLLISCLQNFSCQKCTEIRISKLRTYDSLGLKSGGRKIESGRRISNRHAENISRATFWRKKTKREWADVRWGLGRLWLLRFSNFLFKLFFLSKNELFQIFSPERNLRFFCRFWPKVIFVRLNSGLA